MAAPFKSAEFDIMHDGTGISHEGDILDVAVELGIVDKMGTWYSFEGERLGQGRENCKQFLKDNPDIALKIEQKASAELGIGKSSEIPEEKA